MELNQARQIIETVEKDLADVPFVVAHTFERNGRRLHVALTERLRRRCKRERVWKSKAMLSAFKNAEYGFDPHHAHSSGGYDGIFVLTRDYRPRNGMMRKLFDRFIDSPRNGATALAREMGAPLGDLKPVRLVSHHLRLLGLLKVSEKDDFLVLVDFDDTKQRNV